MPNRKVTVRAISDDAGQIDFELDGVKAKHARMKLDPASGPHDIDFHLEDHSGKGLKFHADDPMWVGENCPCPPAQGMNSDQITVKECNPHKLSTVNANSGDARELRYQLNFKANDGSIQKCDPIMENGGSNLL